MTSERWREITAVFHAALARDAADRDDFVHGACGNDVSLRHEVQSMLAAHAAAHQFGDTPAFANGQGLDSSSSMTELALARGTRVGPYETLSVLGMGGMGVVYRARDTRLHRDVALKVLLPSIAEDPDRLARFTREARVLASLNHPYIAQIYGIEESENVRAIVMELVAGSTLADRIAQGAIPLAEALPIAAQIAEALEAAHELGIIHRDLKPANVKVRSDGTVKVLDFGLAKAPEQNAHDAAQGDDSRTPVKPPSATMQTMTLPGLVVGTVPYMAPEQASGKGADRRADVWAFGCVLFEMITGTRAFTGNQSDTIVAILSKEPDWQRLPRAASRVRPLLVRCLKKDPRQRFQAIGDARIEIEELIAGPVEPQAAAPLGPSAARRLAPTLMAGLAIGAALTALLTWSVMQPGEAPSLRFEIFPPDDNSFGLSLAVMAVSPDGRAVAFHANSREARSTIWVRPLDSQIARQLPGTDRGTQPFWSPDGRFLAFSADGKLKRIEASGGLAQTIADGGSQSGTWNKDGVILRRPGSAGNVFRVSAFGGAETPATTLDQSRGETGHNWPQFLPDGRHFLYHAQSTQPEHDGMLYVGSLDSSTVTPLLKTDSHATYAAPGYLLYLRSNTLVAHPFDANALRFTGEPLPIIERVDYNNISRRGAFSVSATGTLVYRSPEEAQLVWFDRSGRDLGAVAPLARYANPALSPNEQRVAVDRVDPETGTTDIWVIDLVRGNRSRLTDDSAQDQKPLWSPDGNRVLFMSNRGGKASIYQKAASGAGQDEELVSAFNIQNLHDWTPDGFLIYELWKPEPREPALWKMPVSGPPIPSVFLETGGGAAQARLSPDGQWIAYVSSTAETSDVYVQNVPTGEPRLQIGPGLEPRWRGDGKELFYLARDQSLMSVSLTFSPAIEAGRPERLFPTRMLGFQGTNTRNQYVATSDGQRFLINQPPQGTNSSPLSVVVNWTDALKKKRP